MTTPTEPRSRYRCHTHPGEPLTWRGTDCLRCKDGRGGHLTRRERRAARLRAGQWWEAE